MSIAPEQAMPLDDEFALSYRELVAAAGAPEALVHEMVACGALTPHGSDAATWTFAMRSLLVVRKAQRLQHDFELDTHAVTVVLSFLERIEALEAQVRALEAQRR